MEEAKGTATPEKDTQAKAEGTTEAQEDVQAKVARLEAQLEEKDKGLRSAHQKLTQKDLELKKREGLDSRIASLEDQIKFTAALIAETQSGGGAFGEEKKDPKDLLKRFETMKQASEKQRLAEVARQEGMAKITEIKTKVEELGLTEEDDEYWEIEDLATRGRFDRAEARLKRIAKTKEQANPKEEAKAEVKETAEELKARLEKEILIKHGLLKPEGGTPSGSGGGLQSLSPLELARQAYKK